MTRAGHAFRTALVCAPLAGCGSKPEPVIVAGSPIATETVALGNGYGLNLPRTLDGFTRTGTETEPHATGIVAGYARSGAPAPITVAVRVHKANEPGSLEVVEGVVTASTGGPSQSALQNAIAEIRHRHPDAVVTDSRNAFLVRFGAMQAGRAATLSYADEIDGVRQPINLHIETFCCADGRWNYEFRFRYPASLAGAPDPIANFVNDLAWSPQPAASIDKPD